MALESQQDPLTILDEEVSQRESQETPAADSSGFSLASQEFTPWWMRYTKPEAMRQRILKGQKLDSANRRESLKRRRESETSTKPKRRRKKDKLRETYEEKAVQQEADVVDNTW